MITAGSEHLGTGTSDTAWLGRVSVPTVPSHPPPWFAATSVTLQRLCTDCAVNCIHEQSRAWGSGLCPSRKGVEWSLCL